MSMDNADRNCGRIDDHPAHDWRGEEQLPHSMFAPPPRKVTFHCTGHVTTEGGWAAHGQPQDPH